MIMLDSISTGAAFLPSINSITNLQNVQNPLTLPYVTRVRHSDRCVRSIAEPSRVSWCVDLSQKWNRHWPWPCLFLIKKGYKTPKTQGLEGWNVFFKVWFGEALPFCKGNWHSLGSMVSCAWYLKIYRSRMASTILACCLPAWERCSF